MGSCRGNGFQYKGILLFLGVPYDGRKDFPAMNESMAHRMGGLSYFIMGLVTKIKLSKIARSQNYIFRRKEYRVFQNLLTLNFKKNKYDPLRQEFRDVLAEEFRNDVKKLSSLLGRDLTHWLR